MNRIAAAIFLVALFTGCAQSKPKLAAEPAVRKAIEVQYVAVPKLNVYTEPREGAALLTSYGIHETVSVLARHDGWSEIRTVDGSGWVKSAELMSADQAKALTENPSPRFLVAPVQIPDSRARGEIDLNAKVNTDGEVVEVTIANNTTKNGNLAQANASSLLQAKFYPMVQKGQRMTFTYEHKVYY